MAYWTVPISAIFVHNKAINGLLLIRLTISWVLEFDIEDSSKGSSIS
jgi:hypothetical protein